MMLRPRRLTVVVLVIFALIAVSAMVVSQHVVHQEESRLLSERATEVGDQLTGAETTTDTNLSSLATLAPLPEVAESFPAAAAPLLTGSVRSIALIADHDGAFSVVTMVGDDSSLAGTWSAERLALLRRAFTQPDMVSTVLHDGYRRRIGYALALPPNQGNLEVYEESAIDPSDPAFAFNSPFYAGLDVSLYAAGTPSPLALVVADGPAAAQSTGNVIHFQVGAGQWTLIVRATQPLSGAFATEVPWLLLAGGLISAVLAGAVVEVVLRRRDFAMSLVSDRTRELRTSLRNLEGAQAELQHQAFHDALTKLPNRALLIDRIEQALARARRKPTGNAIVFLDLDRFKWVNDSLGHRAGDRLIAAVAERLRSAVRPSDTVARLGGDEFVVLCEDLVDQSGAVAVAQRLAAALGPPFEIDGHNIELTASFGVSFSYATTNSPLDMVRDADLAMYQAKEKGRTRIETFDPAMRSRADARLATEGALRQAIERHQLTVHYQPVVRLSDDAVVGVEALVRWPDERQVLTLPSEFIALAEETGLIHALGSQVLTSACEQAARWTRQRPDAEPLSVSVNISGLQLENPNLPEEVDAALSASGLEPARLWLEITESVLLEESGPSYSTLHTLKEVGVTLVVDDFGTGYSSLLYIRRLPVDVLKIDQSFVAGLGRQRADDTIVSTVIDLAHSMDLTAVAEGVETAGQAKRLAALGCELAQGYFWSPPAEPGAAMAWIESASPVPPPGGTSAQGWRRASGRGATVVPFRRP